MLTQEGAVFLSEAQEILARAAAWRQNDPDAIRDGFVNLLRKSRQEIERVMPGSVLAKAPRFTALRS